MLKRLGESLLASGLLLTLFNVLSWAQGCVMCKTSVANATNSGEISAKFNLGILVVLLPISVMLVAIIRIAYQYRHG
jgi:hypothetical protein